MYDKRFNTLLEMVFADEGGYSNKKNDRGGRTNFGVTQIAMNEYTRKRNLPHKDVENLTREEAKKVLYEDYYLKSGADKQKDIRDAYVLFDTAVNFHPVTAKSMFKKAKGDFYKMLDLRYNAHNKEVKDNPKQVEFQKGWLDRVERITQRVDKLIEDPDFRPDYADEKTPFDDDYIGGLKKVTNITNADEKQKFKNKYQYLLHKNAPTGYAANIEEKAEEDFEPEGEKLSFRDKLLKAREERLAYYTARLAEDPEKIKEREAKHVSLEELKAPQEAKKQKVCDIIEGKVQFDENQDISSYENKKLGSNKIFTQEEIDSMSDEDKHKNKEAIFYQKQTIGVPTEEQAKKAVSKGGMVYVNGYTRSDGTQVKSYYRSR